MCLFHGTSLERVVAFLLVRRWKTMATTRKKTKKMTWTNKPPVMTFWPLFTEDSVLLAVIPAPSFQISYAKRTPKSTSCSPNACMTKDKTSPATKILVSHLNLTREW